MSFSSKKAAPSLLMVAPRYIKGARITSTLGKPNLMVDGLDIMAPVSVVVMHRMGWI